MTARRRGRVNREEGAGQERWKPSLGVYVNVQISITATGKAGAIGGTAIYLRQGVLGCAGNAGGVGGVGCCRAYTKKRM